MATGSKNSMRLWTYLEATRSLPYVRLILTSLRERFISIWHLFKVAGYDPNNPDYCEQMRLLREEAVADLESLKRLGVLPYECPRRGIALFPFVVNDRGTQRQAYFVFKDSRDRVDSFIFNDDLYDHFDLFGSEQPIPEEWRQVGAMPKLEEVRP